jgi:hypothetical protein
MSTIVRLPEGGVFAVQTTAVLAPPDEDCVEVVRLGGHPLEETSLESRTHDGVRSRLLWISFTGRTVSDHMPIVELVPE